MLDVDPTLLDKQGLDSGFKYSSAIFYYDDRQLAIAKRVTTELQALIDAGKIDSYSEKTVKTRLFPASDFYASEPDNQAYLERNIGSTCSALHAYRFRVWPTLS